MATWSQALIRESSWPDPVANDVITYIAGGLTHGPMLGRPTSSSMRVWVRTKKPMAFKVVYAVELPLRGDMAGVEGVTKTQDDNTGHVDLTGLQADTRYYYGIVTNNQLVDTRMDYEAGFPWFRTLPDATSYRDEKYNPKGLFNFSFGTSFGNRQGGNRYCNSPSYATLLKYHADNLLFFIMNGDYIYEATRTRKNRPHKREMFRDDYKIYLERGRDMAKFFRQVPTFFTYDDHETYSDLEGTGEIGLQDGKWLYRDVALGPWYEYCGWANFAGPQYEPILRGTARVEQGETILNDSEADFTKLRPEAINNVHVWMNQKNSGVYSFVEVLDKQQLRVGEAFREDEECRYSVGTHYYYDWKMGNCHFFVLDTRGERTRYVPEKARDADRFLLGETQEKWLVDGIRNSDADFVFIVSSVSWMIYHTNFHVTDKPKLVAGRSVKEDGFTGAVRERDRLLDFFDGLDKQVLIFTGDLHNAFAVQISDNVWEFMMGPINSANHPIETAGNPPFGGWFDSEGTKVKIKWVAGFPNEVKFTRLHSIYYGVIQVNNVLKSGRQNEPGLHWVAYDEPQVVVQFYDGHTGDLVYAEGISTADIE